MADFDPSEPNFDDEDNNPFPHQGIASLMSQSHASTPNSGPGPDPTPNGNPPDDDDDGLILLYNATSKSSDARSATGANGSSNNVAKSANGINELGDLFHTVQINFESRVSKLLKTAGEAKIQITEAGNSNEGMNNSSKKYIVYTIKLINVNDANEEIQTRRRYSDFVSLREVLTKIFPLVIIPPIPPKNYMNMNVLNGFGAQGLGSAGGSGGDSSGGANSSGGSGSGSAPSGVNAALNIHGTATYSYINSTHLAKSRLIEHRKRLLTNFLNNCLEINQIRSLEFFSKFLDPSSNWSDEVSLISNQLPKSVYQLNPENGLRTEAIYASLPNPSSGHMGFLKDNKKKLTNKLLYTRHETEATGGLAVTEPTPPTQTSEETDYILNTSSLDDINKKIMENYIGLSSDYTELGTIFNSFSLVLADTTSRDLKKGSSEDEVKLHIIFDKIGQVFDRSYITINSLIGDLETKFSEPLGEAVQFSNILQHIARFQQKKLRQKQLVDADIKIKRGDLEELLRLEEKSADVKTPKTQPDPSKSKFKMFSIKKITQYVLDIMDQNPDQTRKQKIGYLQTKIKTLESCQNIMLQDISYIADEINKNFKLFHSKQLRAIYEILLSYNRFLITWAKKNIDIWEEVREEVYKL